MKRFIPYISIIVLCIAGFMLFDYKEKVNDLKEKNSMLLIEKEMLRMETYFSSVKERKDLEEAAYHSWAESEALAEQFHKESDQRFKEEWGLFLAEEASRMGIDPYIVFELIRVETGGAFDPNTIGPETKYGRAYGLAQFMKNTAPWIAGMVDLPYEKDLLFDPYYSIQLAIVYLDYLYDKYGDWNEALTAYHRGMGGLEQYIIEHGHAKSWYAKEIQKKANEQKAISLNQKK